MLPPDEEAAELAGKPLERALLDCLAEQLGSSVFG
jgi:hypothetical protein